MFLTSSESKTVKIYDLALSMTPYYRSTAPYIDMSALVRCLSPTNRETKDLRLHFEDRTRKLLRETSNFVMGFNRKISSATSGTEIFWLHT